MRPALALAVLVVACGTTAPDVPAPAADPGPEPAPTVATPEIDPRDQYVLARAMLETMQLPPDDQFEGYDRVHADWQGHRIRWEMMRVAGLCLSAERDCYFAPFDLDRFDHVVTFAFLPRVRFADASQFDAMATACAPHGATCVVTIEATLDRFVFEMGAPTSLTFGSARFVSARAREDGDHFLARPDGMAPAPPLRLPSAGQ